MGAGQHIRIMDGPICTLGTRKGQGRGIVILRVLHAYPAKDLERAYGQEFGLDVARGHLFMCGVSIGVIRGIDALVLAGGLEIEGDVLDGSEVGIAGDVCLHGILVVIVVAGLVPVETTSHELYVAAEEMGIIGEVTVAREVLVLVVLPSVRDYIGSANGDFIGDAVDLAFSVIIDHLLPVV